MASSTTSHILALFLITVTLTAHTQSSVIGMTSSSGEKHHHRKHNAHRSTSSEELSEKSLSSVVDCPTSHFFSHAELVCKPCSSCPVNRIIRRPCTAHADTLCGPFVEFDKFHQAPVAGREGEKERESDEGRKHYGKDRHHKKSHHGHNKQGGPSGHDQQPEVEADLTSLSLEKARSQWRTLSLALIAVLSVICVIVVVVGIYVFVVCRRSREHKHLLREPVYSPVYPDLTVEAEPRYVDPFLTSSPRHLPVYQQIYTGGDVTSESLFTSSTTKLTSESSANDKKKEDGDGYIYFNLPAVNHSEV